jgi:ketosteroid isomerase-like protein
MSARDNIRVILEIFGAIERRDAAVVVLWQQRAVSPTGDGLETPVLGVFHVRDGKLARAQMFYFDTAGVNDFPARASR